MKALALLIAISSINLLGCGGSGTSTPATGTTIGLWCTTNVKSGNVYIQRDRLANPVVNEVFATVANNRHKINDEATPDKDFLELKKDINDFMTNVAGRSQATSDVVTSVLIPDTMKANLTQSGSASYLGVETNGATGGTFGGRALTDDVVDISLGIVFGTTISALGLAPADGKQIPTLTSDNVGPGGKHFQGTFPYLGAPQ
jgi:Domain of unknown function (DUF4331)